MTTIARSNLLSRLSGFAVVTTCACALAIGCEKESPQASKPAPRTNNKAQDTASTPAHTPSTQPGATTTAPAL